MPYTQEELDIIALKQIVAAQRVKLDGLETLLKLSEVSAELYNDLRLLIVPFALQAYELFDLKRNLARTFVTDEQKKRLIPFLTENEKASVRKPKEEDDE